MPFDRLADRLRVINPGSVGLPCGHDGAAWAVLGPDVALRRTGYDTNAAIAHMSTAASDLPGIDNFVQNTRRSASDAEALAAFTETAEIQSRNAENRTRTQKVATPIRHRPALPLVTQERRGIWAGRGC
jgi:hypothetical protein